MERASIAARLRLGAAAASLLLISVLIVQVSNAAFSDSTSTDGNFDAGTVALDDNDWGEASLELTNSFPGDTDTECILVTYSGSLNGEVRLYGNLDSGTGLEDYVDLDVARADGDQTADCGSLTSPTPVWTNAGDGDLGDFLGSATNYATGSDNWAVSSDAADDVVTYQFDVTLQDDDAAQGLTSNVTFTWEVQDTETP